MIHRASLSNGITVMLDIALNLHRKGFIISVYPTFSDPYIKHFELLPKYKELKITRNLPLTFTALIPDTAEPSDVSLIRHHAEKIVFYSLAVPGMFGGCGIPYIERHPGDIEIVYSPQVSNLYNSYYIQPSFTVLEEYIESRNTKLPISEKMFRFDRTKTRKKSKKYNIAIYQGKGMFSDDFPLLIRRLLRESNVTLITRDFPSTKQGLYSLISAQDALISLDSLSSLNFEASLLGIPVYVHNSWDEPFAQNFPVSLIGISFNDPKYFERIFFDGFDQKMVYNSYLMAISKNSSVIDQLMADISSYVCVGEDQKRVNAYLANLYWKNRYERISRAAPLELNLVYEVQYLISGKSFSFSLLVYLFLKFLKKLKGVPFAIANKIIAKTRSILARMIRFLIA